MNKLKKWPFSQVGFIALLCVFIGGCSSDIKPTIVRSIDAGVIVSVSHQPNTWKDWAKTTVTTDKGVFVLGGTLSFFKGESTMVQEYDNGHKYFCIESSNDCPKIWGT